MSQFLCEAPLLLGFNDPELSKTCRQGAHGLAELSFKFSLEIVLFVLLKMGKVRCKIKSWYSKEKVFSIESLKLKCLYLL